LLLDGAFLVDVDGSAFAVAGLAGPDEVHFVIGTACIVGDYVVCFGAGCFVAPVANGVVG
jgi:hypothetical protein